MEFFDCNLFYGPDRGEGQLVVCENLSEIKTALDKAGISGGLVFRAEYEATRANRVLMEDLQGETHLYGILQLLPSMTGETPAPADLPSFMKANRFAAVAFRPEAHRFMVRAFAIGDYLSVLQSHRIPVIMNTKWGITMEQIANIMENYPALTAVIAVGLTIDCCGRF